MMKTLYFDCSSGISGNMTLGALLEIVGAGQGLIKISSILVPFINRFPKNTKLYKLMTTKPGEGM